MANKQTTPVIRPSDEGLYKGVAQIYPIVNEVYKETVGESNGFKAVDTNSFIAQGKDLINRDNIGTYLNNLAKRIGKTVDTYRPYSNRFSVLEKNQLQYGAIVQKIEITVPEATFDESWDVGKMDGQSIDQWEIRLPKAEQTFYEKESAYSYFITIQSKFLKRSVLSETVMQSLISQIFGKVKNKRELIHELLGRLCIANAVVNLPEKQHIHLVTEYNNQTGKSITKQQAKYDAEFLRWASSFINMISDKMNTMSVLFNTAGHEKYSPIKAQRLFMLSTFYTFLEQIPNYLAYAHDTIITKPTIKTPFWQSAGDSITPNWEVTSTVKATNSNGAAVELSDLIGVLSDKETIGTFRDEVDVYTTPVNARGRYYNTFWHEDQMYYYMKDENIVAFFLN